MKLPRLWFASLLIAPLVLFPGPVPAQQGGFLTLDQALTRALGANPNLLAADLAVQANEAEARQVTRRPNPELGMEWENLAGTGDLSGTGASEFSIGASQLFELGGKRGRRGDLARQGAILSKWDRKGQALDLAREVREAFLEVWFAQEEVKLAGDHKIVDEKLLEEIRLRNEAGASSPIDLSRARVVVASSEITRRQADQHLSSTRRRLASLWGSRTPDFSRVSGNFEFAPDPAVAEVSPDWADQNPDLARWQAEEKFQAAELSLARALATPDLTLGMGLKRETSSGDVAFVLEAGLPLPFFDRNLSAIRASGFHLDRTRRLAEAADTEIGARLDIATDQRMAAYQEIEILRRDILPQATEAYDATGEGHRRGLFSLTDVLETRRSLFELRRTLLETLVRYHLADIRISRLVGKPIDAPVEVVE